MKRLLLVLVGALLIMALAACGSSEEVETSNESAEKQESNTVEEEQEEVNAEAVNNNDEENMDEESEEETLKDDEEMLIDEDDYSVEHQKIERTKDEFGDEFIDVRMRVENKTDDYLDFSAGSLSVDDEMVNDENYDMYIETEGGKSAEDRLSIYSFEEDDYELPELEDNLELELWVDDEDMEREDKHDVRIEF